MAIMFLILLLVIITAFLHKRGLFMPKGKYGEKTIAKALDTLPKDTYRVLNDVLLPTPKGSSQIDHIIISVYGIFVIETKNYSGKIYGTENSEYWTQYLPRFEKQFYNPILQNAGHVKALRRVLKEYEPLPILPIVTFSGSAVLRVKIYDACVIYWNQLFSVINQFEDKKLDWSTVINIYEKIQSTRLDDNIDSKKNHLIDIRNTVKKKYDSLSSGKCPRCGGELVLRHGANGDFYGCFNYPQCKFTKKK